jgi:XTP/dITP diphosphohydrolase/ATP diphosphatase
MNETNEQNTTGSAGDFFAEAVAIMARLRGEGGCPWDREQTFDSVRRYTLEETYEVFDAIERRDWPHLREELGDLLLQVLFYAQMADEAGHFNIADVVATLNAKLVRRHPHVFGALAGQGIGTEGVLANWEEFKRQERAEKAAATEKTDALLDGVPRNLPATLEAQKIGSKAAKVGFDWPEISGLFAKLEEEAAELRAELAHPAETQDESRIQAEAGDLLFTAVQIARHAHVDAEMSLRGSNARFRARIEAMENTAAARGTSLDALGPDELEALWTDAKSALKYD